MTTSFDIAYGRKAAVHWEQATVTWSEILDWLEVPGTKKEIQGYVLGKLRPTTRIHKDSKGQPLAPCTDLHRIKSGIESRSALALDIDSPDDTFLEMMDLVFSYQGAMHTTYSSTPEQPRYRLIIPTDRDMAPDEYIMACQSMMQKLGESQFDPGTDQAERFMYKPSAQRPEWYQYWVYDGDTIKVDDLLDDFELDLSSKPLPNPGRNKRDPFEIDGVVGAFNRAYEDWDLLIEAYDLPYDKVDENRYHLVGSKSEAGMGPVQDVAGFVYSHHANDPAFGKTCSAFDLVRLHRFGDLDYGMSPQTPVNKLKSNVAMMEVASTDHRVTAELVQFDFDESDDDEEEKPRSWILGIKRTNKGDFIDSIANWDLVRDNDRVFTSLYFNEFTMVCETIKDLPWRERSQGGPTFTKSDRVALAHYIERAYGIRPSKELLEGLVDAGSRRQWVNPVRDYLDSLEWDGKKRVETCLPGVHPTRYTKLVARKSLVAAVARIYEPGCKWDHTMILYGPEGLGKSWWIEKISKVGFPERQIYSSVLGAIDNKDTWMNLQRSWIMVSDEGHSLKKADQDAQKEFLTRTQDVYRSPYGTEMIPYPRHCVIWGTTNDETFLRRQEGNRRFLIVHSEKKVNFDKITEEYVDQLWAEAVQMYRAGELLFLADDESSLAAQERERFIEEDALSGVLSEYLDGLVPEDWWERSPESRQFWVREHDPNFEKGVLRIDRVCTTQIWVEAMGRRMGDHRRVDLIEISDALKRLGWISTGIQRVPGYGPQTVFIRKDDLL